MRTPLALLLCVAAGTVGGVFFAFSTFVMKALARLPHAQAIAAMQSINAASQQGFIGFIADPQPDIYQRGRCPRPARA